MPDIHTHIVVQRPDGKIETIGRHGQHSPNDIARMFAEKGLGTVVAVRHIMQVAVDARAPVSKAVPRKSTTKTIAIHHIKR